ncbi:hypothetical protein E3U43_011001 [Larimichthys crocea]|uniref:Uncharacterized protein n=1 Tax=Larimichthys crocea TaxID=215358 RepID=A0ACD3RGX5_LARCR|nr:hypothetical protein E3U43_011001 [Larimichthys crocea]
MKGKIDARSIFTAAIKEIRNLQCSPEQEEICSIFFPLNKSILKHSGSLTVDHIFLIHFDGRIFLKLEQQEEVVQTSLTTYNKTSNPFIHPSIQDTKKTCRWDLGEN